MSENIHPAALANMNSIKYAMEKNKTAWLALYRDDAILRDPVGISPLDPTGNGHIGKAAIEQFWDNVIAPSSIKLTPGLRCISGSHHCAVPMHGENDLGGGLVTHIDMIAVYEVDDAGLIKTMNAHWSWDAMQDQFKQLGLA
jgi:hypothetical protein